MAEQKQKQETTENPKKKRSAKRIIGRTLLVLLVALICVGGFGMAYMLGLDVTDKLDPQKILGAEQSTTLYDRNGNTISTVHGLENRTWISISDVPEHVKMTFVAAEDVRFYSHSGVDVKRIFGALWEDIKAGSAVQGASTITQQLIKNSHLTRDKTISRKIEEALLALELERRYTKDAILEMYLNYVYFGAGAYGIQAAAETYFSKNTNELTLAEAATLAAALKSPSNYAPHIEPANNLDRRNTILTTMDEEGFAGTSDIQEAMSQPIGLKMSEANNEFGWYTDAAMEQAAEILGISYDELVTGG